MSFSVDYKIYYTPPHKPLKQKVHKKSEVSSTSFKTELCKKFTLGNCPYEANCKFAHGNEELRERVPPNAKYKTKECLNFRDKGVCTFGVRCLFSHKISKNLKELNLWNFQCLRKEECDEEESLHWELKAKESLRDSPKSIKKLILDDLGITSE